RGVSHGEKYPRASRLPGEPSRASRIASSGGTSRDEHQQEQQQWSFSAPPSPGEGGASLFDRRCGLIWRYECVCAQFINDLNRYLRTPHPLAPISMAFRGSELCRSV